MASWTVSFRGEPDRTVLVTADDVFTELGWVTFNRWEDIPERELAGMGSVPASGRRAVQVALFPEGAVLGIRRT